ncbi:S8 family serine peptidase [Conexibacter sp. DBS9H8]|uniref:S53 family peptidase n=1 Tax=Conexibacter sp. DBS9H8 TaxID=2937801 RepID=UPI00200CA3B3|nr:S53 family peptidase [Conexibacter sp. DBS9H8]
MIARRPSRRISRRFRLALLSALLATGCLSTPALGAPSAGPAPVILGLALPHRAELTRVLSGLYRPGSPSFHHFLTPGAFRARFAPAPGEVAAVLARLRALGLDGRVGASGLFVSVAPPQREAHLVSLLSHGLGGLVDAVITPAQQPTPTPQIRVPADQRAGLAPHAAEPGVAGGASACAAAASAGGDTAPQLATGYDFNGLYAQGFLGAGQSAAVLEYGGFHNVNLTGFTACYHLHTPVSRVSVDGGAGAPAGSSEDEVALDIQVLLEMAPQLAHLYVYEAPNTGTGELAAYGAFVSEDRAPVLSVSWGECEEGASQSYERLLGAITEEAAAQGQQIFVAAGDSGSKGCAGEALPTGASLSVDSEAALPWVTGVGGTDLSQASVAPGATVHREAVWNDGLGAGGGGESVVWSMPSWQRSYLAASGAHPQGMSNDCGAPAGEFCRMEPDISFDADAEEGGGDPLYWNVPSGPTPAQFSAFGDRGSPGYTMYCVTPNCSAGGNGWMRVGGTSAATPLAAAAAVLWDQAAAAAGLRIGFLNPSLYAVAANPAAYARDFYDVQSGSNDDMYASAKCPLGCGSTSYRAGPGYDMATGLGAVNVAHITPDLLAAAGALTVTPDHVQVYGDTHGGPSTTAPVSLSAGTLPTAGIAAQAVSSAPWLHVVADAHIPGSLRWRADPAGLAPGTHHATITVTAANGATATLTVTDTVTPPARIGLITRTLRFQERQVTPFQGRREVCGAPLWGDELEAHGVLPGSVGISTVGDQAPGTRRTLAFVNDGAPGSVLHYAVDQDSVGWISNDLDPHNRPQAIQLRAGQPLVPSEGAVRHGGRAAIALASVANANADGGYPALQQGTYHGTITVIDLADPADRVRVPVTLVLGDGRGTPRVGVRERRLSARARPGQTVTLALTLDDPGGACGYGYSIGSDRSWLSPSASRHTGVVVAGHVRRVPIRVTIPSGTAPGRLRAIVTIVSLNAAASPVRVPVTVNVG